MSKNKRGKNVKAAGWRGICPSCKRTGVKLLWTKTEGEDTINVCKHCGN